MKLALMDSSISASASMDQLQNSNYDTDYDDKTPSKAKLLETINQLKSENQQIKEQFDEALSISKLIEETHKKNAALTAEIRQISSEKEDIQRRLLISMQTINELNEKINQLKQNQNILLDINQEKTSKEIEKIRSEEHEKYEKIKNDYNQLQRELEEKSIALQLITNKIDRALQNGERYFHVTISDFEMLISLLSQPQLVIQSNDSKSPNALSDAASKKDESTRLLKNSLKKMANKFRNLEQEKNDEIDQLKREISNLKRISNNEKEKYEATISDLNEEKGNFETQSKLKIESLEKAIESLKNERQTINEIPLNNSNEKDIFSIQEIESEHRIQMQKQQQQMNTKIDELEEQFQHKMYELSEKLEKSQNEKDEYIKQLAEKEKIMQKLELDFERIKGELSSLRIIHKESQNEIDSLRIALHSTTDENLKSKNSPTKSNSKFTQDQFSRLTKEVDRQKFEIEQLKNEKSNDNKEKSQYLKTIKELEADLNEAKNKLMKTEESFDQYCLEMQRQRKPTVDDLLPPSIFMCNDIIADNNTLNSMVERIATNSSLQPASKIKNILKSVINYYEQQIESLRDILQTENEKNDAIKQSFNKFLIDSSLIISEEPFTLDDFLNPKKSEIYLKKLSEMKEQLNLLLHNCASYKLVFDHFDDLLKDAKFKPNNNQSNAESDFDQMISHVEQFRLAWQEQANNSKTINKKMKHLMNNYLELKKENERQIKEYDINLEQAKIQIDESEKKIIDQDKLIKKNKQDLAAKNREIEQLRLSKEEMENEIKLMNEDSLSIISSTMKEKENKFKQLTTDLNKKLNESENEKGEIENKLKVCQKLLQLERKNCQKLENEVRDLQKEMHEREQRSQLRLKEEKKQLADSFERTFDQLRKQCETYRNDVQKISFALSESDEDNKQLKVQIMTLQNEKNQLLEQLKSNDETNARQKRLYETSLKAKLMAVDTEYNKKLEQMQVQNEVEMRKIFSFFADSFRTYFNPSIQINEKSFRIIVDQVRQQLEKYSQSDASIRKMLSIPEHQPIEDAVAQILLDKTS